MDDLENEESFQMVRTHRDCYPKGERVLLASESKCLGLIRASKEAEQQSRAWQ